MKQRQAQADSATIHAARKLPNIFMKRFIFKDIFYQIGMVLGEKRHVRIYGIIIGVPYAGNEVEPC
jgi:hypothetical protein